MIPTIRLAAYPRQRYLSFAEGGSDPEGFPNGIDWDPRDPQGFPRDSAQSFTRLPTLPCSYETRHPIHNSDIINAFLVYRGTSLANLQRFFFKATLLVT